MEQEPWRPSAQAPPPQVGQPAPRGRRLDGRGQSPAPTSPAHVGVASPESGLGARVLLTTASARLPAAPKPPKSLSRVFSASGSEPDPSRRHVPTPGWRRARAGGSHLLAGPSPRRRFRSLRGTDPDRTPEDAVSTPDPVTPLYLRGSERRSSPPGAGRRMQALEPGAPGWAPADASGGVRFPRCAPECDSGGRTCLAPSALSPGWGEDPELPPGFANKYNICKEPPDERLAGRHAAKDGHFSSLIHVPVSA